MGARPRASHDDYIGQASARDIEGPGALRDEARFTAYPASSNRQAYSKRVPESGSISKTRGVHRQRQPRPHGAVPDMRDAG